MKLIAILMTMLVFAPQTQTQTRTSHRIPRERPAAIATTDAGQTLPVRRVILYSNGVAYFERRGTVTGRAEVNLSFK